jgi:hypothetical protein
MFYLAPLPRYLEHECFHGQIPPEQRRSVERPCRIAVRDRSPLGDQGGSTAQDAGFGTTAGPQSEMATIKPNGYFRNPKHVWDTLA